MKPAFPGSRRKDEGMKHYKCRYIMHEPSEETEDKHMAEIPALPGCRAWGDTPEDALDILQSVATASIEVYIERGYELPAKVRYFSSPCTGMSFWP